MFLIGALGLSGLLLVFGSGPGRSGVKVNLFGVQPVEAIRPLVALFLAGYFARRWELLRELADPLARRHAILKRLHLPRVADLIPVAIGMALVLLFFFFQRDLGPALVLACMFLATYSVARDRWGLAALGLATLVGALHRRPTPSATRRRSSSASTCGSRRGTTASAAATRSRRRCGASPPAACWAAACRETSPRYIPTGENDLVLASLGEILGFAGVALALALFATLVIRALRIARRTDQPYVALLVVGLVTSLAAQALLIVGGLLGLLPLSGVVTPFLSLGRSSMVSNLAVVGLLLAASRQAPPAEARPFQRPASRVGMVVAALLARRGGARLPGAGVVARRDHDAADPDAAGGRRGAAAGQPAAARGGAAPPARRDPRSPRPAARHGLDPRRERAPEGLRRARRQPVRHVGDGAGRSSADGGGRPAAGGPGRMPGERCYPLGGSAFHLLGDSVTQANWAATNSTSSSATSTPGCAATRTIRSCWRSGTIATIRSISACAPSASGHAT